MRSSAKERGLGVLLLVILVLVVLLIIIFILFLRPHSKVTSNNNPSAPSSQSKPTYPSSANATPLSSAPANLTAVAQNSTTPYQLMDANNLTGWQFFIDPPGKKLQYTLSQHQQTPSQDSNSMALSIVKGDPYSNIQAFYYTPPQDQVAYVDLSVSFYLPDTSYNNEGVNSLVQAAEFSIMKHHLGKRWEWALSWQNVHEAANRPGTVWTIWNGHDWVPTPVIEKLAPNKWHTLEIKGYVDSGQNVHYLSFASDGVTHDISQYTYSPITFAGENMEIALQIDGNYVEDPYTVYYDKINLQTANSYP